MGLKETAGSRIGFPGGSRSLRAHPGGVTEFSDILAELFQNAVPVPHAAGEEP